MNAEYAFFEGFIQLPFSVFGMVVIIQQDGRNSMCKLSRTYSKSARETHLGWQSVLSHCRGEKGGSLLCCGWETRLLMQGLGLNSNSLFTLPI